MSQFRSVFLVEDHVIVRKGFKELIENMGNYKVTAEFDNGRQLINKVHDSKPDIIIMDLTMPIMDGQETMKWMKENNVKHPVLILTLDTSDKTIIELYKSGVRGYLPKTCTAQTLKTAIDDIINSGYYHNELLSNALLKNDEKSEPSTKQQLLNLCSDRELIFLELVCSADEFTYEQIADKMGVHRRTVDGYRESLFDKFKVKSKTGLVLFSIKHNLVNL